MPIIGGRQVGVRGLGFQGAGKPNQVTGLSATDFGTSRAFNNGRIDLSWTAPADNGAPITGYRIERSTDNVSYSAISVNTGTTSTSYSDTGLNSNQIYYYKVAAINAVDTGPLSTAANATSTTVPQAPTIGTATAGNAQATVTYMVNATGGKAISTFTATSSPGSLTGTGASPITVTGLTNETAYTFTVTATNANGTSTASDASNSVTPIPSLVVDFFVVAGGGAGGSQANGGGGGAGGYRASSGTSGASSAAESRVAVSTATNYTVTVGAGGAGGQNVPTNGSTSVFANITSVGGGRGANETNGHTAGNGGSGGGGATGNNAKTGGSGTANQGTSGGGGNGVNVGRAGGGGGASNGGSAGGDNFLGNGGSGILSNLTGLTLAGGGGGGNNFGSVATGGSGGGGNGASNTNSAAANAGGASTGGGGGGGVPNYFGASGGSGKVVLVYPSAYTATVGAGLTASTNTSGNNKITAFNAGTGNVSWS